MVVYRQRFIISSRAVKLDRQAPERGRVERVERYGAPQCIEQVRDTAEQSMYLTIARQDGGIVRSEVPRLADFPQRARKIPCRYSNDGPDAVRCRK